MSRRDRYKEYTGIIFKYPYPFEWAKRNKNYLRTLSEEPKRDLEEEQDYIFPEERVECENVN